MSPQELNLFVAATANALYETLPPERLAVLAAVMVQLGDTLAAMAAQAAFLGKVKISRSGSYLKKVTAR